LRFDLSGLGDSLPRPGAATAEERRRLDVVDAMDYLQAKGSANRFILGGLCSGAYLTHHMALADDRVAGAIFLDGYAFRTPAYHRVRFVERYLSVDRWRKYVRRQLNRARAVERDVPFRPDDEYFDALPSKSQLRADVARLLERGVKSLWLYTGGVPELFAGGAQFKQMFGDIVGFERLDYRFFNDVEHTFPFKDDRSRLRRAVVEWIRSRFPECVRASETKSNELNASSID
jgi:dienelactone hydrolase